MTQYISGSETVRHERLLDQIKVRAAFQTPLLARLPHDTTNHIITEYPLDVPFASGDAVRNIAAPHADAKREGAAFDYETASYELRMKNICEIKHHGVEMSGSDRSAVIAGMENPWDYRTGKVFTKHLNSIDNTGMYGIGSPETGGVSGFDGTSSSRTFGAANAGDERRMQGLIFNSAWTGLQRQHGASAISTVTDPYGTDIPSDYWSVFTDFEHSNITMESFYNNLIAPALTAGADFESPWMFQCGYRVMQRVARFLIADGGIPINERQRSADDTSGSDYLNMFRLASGNIVTFRTNRWLNETDDTFSCDNRSESTLYTPGSPSSGGDQNRTLYGDQTIIGHEPGCVRWLWYREPGFRTVSTQGDFDRLAIVSEMTLMVDHPLSVIGAGNVLA
jgi:hypothetical protein